MPSRRDMLAGAGIVALAALSAPPRIACAAPMKHVVLLGDSTLDNAAYVRAGDDVSSQLRSLQAPDWRATLLAVDGDVAAGVARQLSRLPADASHLVVSVGGNDALGFASVLREPARSVAEAVETLATVRDRFADRYRAMLDAVSERQLPTAICTIYGGALTDPVERRLGGTALCVLNDVITREAVARGLPLLDLRLIFSEDADYANPIEPSARGGRKFAAAIVDLLSEHDFRSGRSEIFVNTSAA